PSRSSSERLSTPPPGPAGMTMQPWDLSPVVDPRRRCPLHERHLLSLSTGGAALAFKGWPIEAVEIYEGLEADNTKAYWQAHKAVYDECVKGPMEEVLAELSEEFGAGRVFRPYRAVRFSSDKTPYKLNCAAHLPGGYLSFAADGLM